MNSEKQPRVFLSPPHLGGAERRHVEEAFASNYIAPLGPKVNAFEAAFAEYTGIPHCCALASGTAATHLALRHLLDSPVLRNRARQGIAGSPGPQDSRTMDRPWPHGQWPRAAAAPDSATHGPPTSDVRLPTTDLRPLVLAATLTFIGSVSPATFEDCDLTFIDSAPGSWNLDPALLEQELAACATRGRLPVAVIPTDLYGDCCDLPRIVAICDRFGVPVICDSAEAMGARYRSQKSEVRSQRSEGGEEGASGWRTANPLAGPVTENRALQGQAGADTEPRTLSPDPSLWRHAGFDAWAAVYSFNGNKIMTSSGGGMLASRDKALIEHARKLATQARDPLPYYEHTEIGYNYRMSNIVAAVGLGQLEVLEERVARKGAIRRIYQEELAGVPGIRFMPIGEGQRPNGWLAVILIDEAVFGASPEAVRLALEAADIEARPVWKPMHLQPVFQPDGAYGSRHEIRVVGGAQSEALFRQGLCLPSGTAMDDDQIRRIAAAIAAVP